MALSLAVSMGTSTKDFLRVSNQVPPGGKAACIVAILGGGEGQWAIWKDEVVLWRTLARGVLQWLRVGNDDGEAVIGQQIRDRSDS